MRINNNIMALNAHRQLGINNTSTAKSLEKLSSGYRINRAGDDAAGLAISEKMRAQIRGLNMASKNAQDGISLIQTAEGALTESHAILQRMREISVQAASDTNDKDVDRAAIQEEANALVSELNRISSDINFNGKKLLDGSLSGATSVLNIHIGADINQAMTIKIGNMAATALGVSGIKINAQTLANNAISTINAAINKVSTQRSKLGAYQNRLEHTIKNLDNASENLAAAESRIRDVDMAKEMMEFTKQNILQQAATAMLAQANMAPQTVLKLLG